MHKNILIKANDSGFFIEKSYGISVPNINALIEDLNECFPNLIKSGVNPDTIFININNLSDINFVEPAHENFSSLYYNKKDELVTYSDNNFFADNYRKLHSILNNFIRNESLLFSSFLFYSEPYYYMVCIKQNRIDCFLNEILNIQKESEIKAVIWAACSFNYILSHLTNNDIENLLTNKFFVNLLNKSKNKIYFLNKTFYQQNYIFSLLSEKLLVNKKEFLFLFKVISEQDYSYGLFKLESFINSNYFKINSEGIGTKYFLDILKNNNSRSENINVLKYKIKSILNFKNF